MCDSWPRSGSSSVAPSSPPRLRARASWSLAGLSFIAAASLPGSNRGNGSA